MNMAEEYAGAAGGRIGGRIGQAIAGYFGGDAAGYSNYFAGLWSSAASSWARANLGGSNTSICYVRDPSLCAAARESELFPGAKWRSCDN